MDVGAGGAGSEKLIVPCPGAGCPHVRFGSFATELVKVDADTCPLRSESDRNIAVPRMNAIAKSGPTTPALGCISCRGAKRQISTTSLTFAPPIPLVTISDRSRSSPWQALRAKAYPHAALLSCHLLDLCKPQVPLPSATCAPTACYTKQWQPDNTA
jgi:hypothetical protein